MTMQLRLTLLIKLLLGGAACAAPAQLEPVQPADTLWRLATKARPDQQVTMPQVIYALWQANPQAFIRADINALRAGSRLTVPTKQQMQSVSVAQARQWFDNALAGDVSTISTTAGTAATPRHNAGQSAALPASSSTLDTGTSSPDTATVPRPAAQTPIAASTAATISTDDASSWRDNLTTDYNLTLQQRYYPQTGAQGQAKAHSSVAVSAEWVWLSDDRAHQLALEPLLRWDQRDAERNLIDLRQAYWQYAGDGYDVKAGIDIVFWGVTESQHLVDVINQTDLVASIDGEAKLGQPMLNWNIYGDGGTLALYLLPYFRERTLPGPDGRLRLPLVFASDDPLYESAQAEKNLDFALRWSRQFDALDLGLSYFEGNNREPEFIATAQGQLRPQYLQMQQLGLDAQMIAGSWIWKLESIYRKTRQQDFVAATAGFEYTQVGIFASNWDLGWIAEYQYDSRDELAPVPGQHDLFIGGRFVANDAAGSEILLGLVQDLDNSASQSGKLEASMRLSNSLRLRLDAWFFRSELPLAPLYFIRRDDYLQLSLDYYF